MFICQNSEGVHPYLLKSCSGTCSFVGMLKGYTARKRLETPGLNHRTLKSQTTANALCDIFKMFLFIWEYERMLLLSKTKSNKWKNTISLSF